MNSEQIEKTIRHLSRAFRIATHDLPIGDKNGNAEQRKAYRLQVDFSYRIDAIARGPKYRLVKEISECNKLISSIKRDMEQ